MSDIQSVPNHTVDPATGFIESLGYANAFDAQRKTAFLKLYRENGLRLRRACRSMGLSEDSVQRHYRLDPVFKDQFDAVEKDYIDELEGVSRDNALNPKSVIERIFQLKCLLPLKYGQENKPTVANITINIDGKLLEQSKQHEQVIDAKIVEEQQSRSKVSTQLLQEKSVDDHRD